MKTIITTIFILLIHSIAWADDATAQPPEYKNDNIGQQAVDDLKDKMETEKDLTDSLSKLNPIKDSLKIVLLKNELDKVKQAKEKLLQKIEKLTDKGNTTILSIFILIFGLSIILSILLFYKYKAAETNFHPFKLIGIMFIGTITVFLIPAGFSNSQITPVIGLLGTLAGYLVGSSTAGVASSTPPQTPTTQAPVIPPSIPSPPAQPSSGVG
jgi:membrane-associated HD superfamily phosphohydrolase